MKIEEKLVSIVLPTYNGERFLRETIESVIKQTYENWELIIVNDCSTDNTLAIANEYEQKDSRISVISNKINKKTPQTLNVGFQKAKGEYFTWISDDNLFKEDAIAYMSSYLSAHPDIDLISCNFDFVDEDLNFTKTMKDVCNNIRREQAQLAQFCQIGACFMYTRSIAEKTGGYDPDFFLADDYEYWCRIAQVGKIAYEDNVNLYIYRMHPNNLTTKKAIELAEKTYAIKIKHSNKILESLGYNSKRRCEILIDMYYENKEKGNVGTDRKHK